MLAMIQLSRGYNAFNKGVMAYNVTSCANLQDDASFSNVDAPIYILTFVLVSLVYITFDWLVLLRVRGNSKLGTTIKFILLWISTSAYIKFYYQTQVQLGC